MGDSDYGQRFLPKDSLEELRANFQEGRKVRVAGRVMTRREMGKSTFCDLKDESGRMQLYAKKDVLGEEGYKVFRDLSLGDIIGVEGELFNSKTGEHTIKIEKFERLSIHTLEN